ncbi:hypothetical protein GLOTRDRAFT_134167 [Gloeophyllum trabeum ATCC 11539]|uniref:Uncharacterized protein n=1 Tax=Gloeophyllum trabeum (strain ATCC 11539 / FP-39264 / Madison 617) TaxID=670483 RepID=S7PS37_GLOTA|nr:uncharacterized protein GLOTRDRAFT_134167 [Gloeophyllum trabeum ATCC 11539]EPQ50197.1 hypothetical protein GLOTRDRAFT_134167 [Gloeophyllum trabeum ATCC 11539]
MGLEDALCRLGEDGPTGPPVNWILVRNYGRFASFLSDFKMLAAPTARASCIG